MAEVDDWAPVGAAQQQDDWQPVAQQDAAVPQAFIDRVERGSAISRILKSAVSGAKEGFGDQTPTGMSDETLDQMMGLGIFHDPTKGQPSPIQFANETMLLPTAKAFDTLLRGLNAGLHGAAGAMGELVDTLGGRGEQARREVINAGNWAMIEGGMGRFSRPKLHPVGPEDQIVGGLPKDGDFKAAAAIIDEKVRAPAVRVNGKIYEDMNHGIAADKAEADLGRPPKLEEIESGFTTTAGRFIDRDEAARIAGKVEDLQSADLARNETESRLRQLWEEKGIHPAEAVNDAQNDAFLKHDLTAPAEEPPRDTYYIGTEGEFSASRLVEMGGSSKEKAIFLADSTHAARDYGETITEVKLDAKNPKIINWPAREGVPERTRRLGLESWYDEDDMAREINRARADGHDVLFINNIEEQGSRAGAAHTQVAVLDPDIIRPGKSSAPSPEETSASAGARQAEIERLQWIAAGRPPSALGAEVTSLPPVTPITPTTTPPPASSLLTAAQNAVDKLYDVGHDIQMLTTPMARGTQEAQATAKDFANSMRRNRWEWSRIDDDIAKRFTVEQRKRMWDAADEESVVRQEFKDKPEQMELALEHQGLVTLEPAEREAVVALQTRAQTAWLRAVDLGMVEGDGLPSYTPRMIINSIEARFGEKKGIPLNGLGTNLRTTTSALKKRKYLTAEETEAAAKASLGEEARLARDIRTLPLRTAQLEDAIAGRALINNIKEIGKRSGEDTVMEGARPAGSDVKWFTIDHPAFRTWRPRYEEADTAAYRAAYEARTGEPLSEAKLPLRDRNGDIVFDQVPIYVREDFEGPLRAVLNQKNGALYNAAMSLKGKTMSLIMNSPLIHNAVEWGRAIPAMPGKVVTFKVYFEGNRAKNNIPLMREAVDNGLVPIGHRFFNQDISSIMEEPNLTPGRSWTSQVLGAVPGLFDEAAGNAVKAAVDKAGNFWHNTLLWDRVADLQMGLYTNFRSNLMAKGVDQQTASRAAAHWANRYAGALPQEAMSEGARKIANMLLFSRTFTLGNIGAMKDIFTGLPKDVMAQVSRDVGNLDPSAAGYIKKLAMRKAVAIVGMDMALMYVGNSLLQSGINVLGGDRTLDEEMHQYALRMSAALQERQEHPLKLLQPFDFLEQVSSTGENEPGKRDRLRIGMAKDGTAIYARNPVGKIGEEFMGWGTSPLDMIRRKEGTIARPLWQIMANDKGFGRKVYDPNADVPDKYLDNLGLIVTHLVASQFPMNQIGAAVDLVKGEGDSKVAALQTFGPITGVTFSKGAPGGPAVGELYHTREMHDYAVQAAMSDIRKQIVRGDIGGAREHMRELGIPKGLQDFYVRTSINPATRLNGRTGRDFYLYATPEQRQRLENARALSNPPQAE